ncbi:protein FAM81B [Lepisosteus oculatus]|uniref:protein FAM81B n=1 Tax=Lepisosteus oculatus TaxID=7918 RepID=UPI003721F500
MSRETVLQVYQPHPDRLGFLEGRLSNQEHSMAVLLEQAFRIKEDILANLRASQGASVSEATSRRLLESHIHTITHIVKQLSKDIEVLEGQILQRDSVSSGTSFAVQSLDHKNLAGIGDLRGRVARCDASIAKLSGDVTAAGQEVHRLHKEILDVRAALDLRLKEMELKVTQVLEKVENSLAEQSSRMTATRGDQHHEIQLLELKTSGTLAELRGLMERHREWAEQQLSGSERARAHGAEQLRALLRDRLEESEKKLGEQVSGLALRLEKAEEQQELEVRANREKRAEDRLNTRIGKLEARVWEELGLIRKEYRSGFQSIHDALSSLKEINETKSRLDKEKLRKDIKQIQRKIVQLKDV